MKVSHFLRFCLGLLILVSVTAACSKHKSGKDKTDPDVTLMVSPGGEIEMVAGAELRCKAEVYPETEGAVITWRSTDTDVALVNDGLITAIAPGNATIVITCFKKVAYMYLTVKEVPELYRVDFGLPSRNLWGTQNIVAGRQGYNEPYDVGDFYAWGETETRKAYDWNHYTWYKDDKLTKYCTFSQYGEVDGRSTLMLEDDIARTKCGAKWCIPTREDWQELIDNCTWTWDAQKQGMRVSRTVDGSERTIFLRGTNLIKGVLPEDTTSSFGFYWSSSMVPDSPLYAYYLYFYNDKTKGPVVKIDQYTYEYRYAGMTVRGIFRRQ